MAKVSFKKDPKVSILLSQEEAAYLKLLLANLTGTCMGVSGEQGEFFYDLYAQLDDLITLDEDDVLHHKIQLRNY